MDGDMNTALSVFFINNVVVSFGDSIATIHADCYTPFELMVQARVRQVMEKHGAGHSYHRLVEAATASSPLWCEIERICSTFATASAVVESRHSSEDEKQESLFEFKTNTSFMSAEQRDIFTSFQEVQSVVREVSLMPAAEAKNFLQTSMLLIINPRHPNSPKIRRLMDVVWQMCGQAAAEQVASDNGVPFGVLIESGLVERFPRPEPFVFSSDVRGY